VYFSGVLGSGRFFNGIALSSNQHIKTNPYYAALKLHDMAAAAAFFVCFA